MSCTPLPKAAKPVWAKQLTRLPCLVVYAKFQFIGLLLSALVVSRQTWSSDMFLRQKVAANWWLLATLSSLHETDRAQPSRSEL